MSFPQVKVDHVIAVLGLGELDIRWDERSSPGGDPKNVAFVRSGPDLRQFTVEYNFDNCDEDEIRTTILHELLHIALRHVASAINALDDGALKRVFLGALEEDTETLVEQLNKVLPWEMLVDP